VFSDSEIIGTISFSEYPEVDCPVMHVTVVPEFHGRWINRSIAKTIAEYFFKELGLPKAACISIEGVTVKAGETAKRLGFKATGRDFFVNDVRVRVYEMTKDECRWLNRR
jgi:RimJ/RimL family protein N-acetyltransferase